MGEHDRDDDELCTFDTNTSQRETSLIEAPGFSLTPACIADPVTVYQLRNEHIIHQLISHRTNALMDPRTNSTTYINLQVNLDNFIKTHLSIAKISKFAYGVAFLCHTIKNFENG